MKRCFYILFSISLFLAACSSSKKTVHVQYNRKEAIIEEKPDPEKKTNPIVTRNVIKNEVDPNRALKDKYAKYLGVPADGTPYKWGGTDEKGIDCSAFIQRLLNDVYNLKIPRTSIEQLYTNRVERFRSVKYLSEGDILFFRTIDGTFVSHVGIYLDNYMFINASSSKGVSLANLKDSYWQRRFVAAGRVIVAVAKANFLHNLSTNHL